MGMVIERCNVFLVRLDPATGAEKAKTRFSMIAEWALLSY
jgi:mRNA-degrading endonuclease toxin of MazEF toxin-antitoxin module